MNPPAHRLVLTLAAFALAVAIGGAVIADGYLSAEHGAPVPVVAAVSVTAPPVASESATPQVVYVHPAPPRKVIHVIRTASPAPARVVHVTVPSVGGSGEGGGNDDGGGGDG